MVCEEERKEILWSIPVGYPIVCGDLVPGVGEENKMTSKGDKGRCK